MDSPGTRETRAFASEIKFVLPRTTGLAVRDWARRHLDPDPHGIGPFGDEYRTSTLYFDSAAYDVYHRRGSFGRSKYRIRRYDRMAEVFLERKLRRPGMLTKRRTLVPLPALARLESIEPAGWTGDWFHRRLLLRRLRPVCEISYTRVARGADTPGGPIRLTLDDALEVRRTHQLAFEEGRTGREGLGVLNGCMILELKFRGDVPVPFKKLVEEFRLAPQTASKYRMGIAALDPEGTTAAADTVVAVVAVPRRATAPGVEPAPAGPVCD